MFDRIARENGPSLSHYQGASLVMIDIIESHVNHLWPSENILGTEIQTDHESERGWGRKHYEKREKDSEKETEKGKERKKKNKSEKRT